MPQVKAYPNIQGLTWESENDVPILRRYGHATGALQKLAKRPFSTSSARYAVITANTHYGLLGGAHKRGNKAHKPGPASRYNTPELVEALRTVWMASDQLCSKRLKAALPLWLPHYETSFHPLSRIRSSSWIVSRRVCLSQTCKSLSFGCAACCHNCWRALASSAWPTRSIAYNSPIRASASAAIGLYRSQFLREPRYHRLLRVIH